MFTLWCTSHHGIAAGLLHALGTLLLGAEHAVPTRDFESVTPGSVPKPPPGWLYDGSRAGSNQQPPPQQLENHT